MFSVRWMVLLVTTHLTRADVWPDLLPNMSVCGTGSDFDQFPWMALIEYQKPDGIRTFLCGGSLISKRYVLTSAVCLKQALAVNWKIFTYSTLPYEDREYLHDITKINDISLGVRLGEYNLNTDPDCIKSVKGVQCAPPPVNLQIEEVMAHEDYALNDTNNSHDIGLIRLKEEVEFTETVKPICLPLTLEVRSKTYLGRKLTVAGWGRTASANSSPIKRKVKLPVTDREACKSLYIKSRIDLGDGQFCAGGEPGRDSCKGDTGNSIIAANVDESAKVHWYAVGIVSFGPKICGLKDFPGVYTNISAYMPWILNRLKS